MEAVMDPDSMRDQKIEELIRLYQVPLLRLCYVQLQDKALAEDAVQETFLKACNGLGTFRGESSEKTWLTRIAMNVCRDYQRGSWFKHTDRSITPDMLQIGEVQPDTEDMDLSLAVMKLPRKLREAVLLYYYQDINSKRGRREQPRWSPRRVRNEGLCGDFLLLGNSGMWYYLNVATGTIITKNFTFPAPERMIHRRLRDVSERLHSMDQKQSRP